MKVNLIRLADLAEQRKTIKEMAQIMKCCENTIRFYVKKFGINVYSRKTLIDETIENKIVELNKQQSPAIFIVYKKEVKEKIS